jgi:hypothetical protein
VTHLQVDETTMMFTQHAVFAEPLTEDDTTEGEDQDTESEPKTFDADTQQQKTATDNTQETDDKDSDEPAPDWTVPPASTFLRFYSDEPAYLTTKTETDISTTATALTAPEDPTSTRMVAPPSSMNSAHANSLNPSRSLTEDEGSSSVSPPNLGNPIPQCGQYRQDLPSLNLWDASPIPLRQPNYLYRPCSICDKHMVTLNPFKTLTCHACLQWIQKSLDPKDLYHNEERDAEEEF